MKILLTGASGFLGKHLSTRFNELEVYYYSTSSKAYDLRQQAHIDDLFELVQPDIVYHLAAHVGGIQYNIDNPAILYYDNIMMNTQLIHKAALSSVRKFVFVSSACIYPEHCPTPMREHMIWNGYPEPSNGTYGLSKRIVLSQLEACYEQFGMLFEYPILANMYGPGDNFSDEKSHVIPALIKRFIDAKDNGLETITIWGTGLATRDFLYVNDAVNALVRFLDIDAQEPLNIANGFGITIKKLVQIIAEIVDYTGTIVYDYTKPNGQMNRSYNIKLAKQILNWYPQVDIYEGLNKTIKWYRGEK